MVAFASSTPISLRNTSTTNVTTTRPCMVAGKTISETIASNPNYTTLNKLLQATSLDLDSVGGTLFAPTNKAFSELREGYLDEICSDIEAAKALLLRHLVPKETLTVKDIKKLGTGYWYSVPGGPLPFEANGVATIKVSGANVEPYVEEDECDNGIIHALRDVILDLPKNVYDTPSFDQQATVAKINIAKIVQVDETFYGNRGRKAAGATSTVGGRKAMSLMNQLPFWMYGPPFNAGKQEDYEPISIAEPEFGTGVDYQLMPPGSVIVTPDEVDASKLNPVSGMSKYIGKTKRLVEGDGLSDYSKLDDL